MLGIIFASKLRSAHYQIPKCLPSIIMSSVYYTIVACKYYKSGKFIEKAVKNVLAASSFTHIQLHSSPLGTHIRINTITCKCIYVHKHIHTHIQ